MLPQPNRLSKKIDFDRVYKKGKRLKFGPFLIGYLPNNFDSLRLGFVVSKKVSNKATRRNYLKRSLRAAFSSLLKEPNLGYDVIVSLLSDPGQARSPESPKGPPSGRVQSPKVKLHQEFLKTKDQFLRSLKAGR